MGPVLSLIDLLFLVNVNNGMKSSYWDKLQLAFFNYKVENDLGS